MPKRKELERHLRQHGAEFEREGGRHSLWIVPGTGRSAAIPRHREISPLMARKICKDLGIPPLR
jgi:mRNA interferase HicA